MWSALLSLLVFSNSYAHKVVCSATSMVFKIDYEYLHYEWKSEATVSLVLVRQTCGQPLGRILSFLVSSYSYAHKVVCSATSLFFKIDDEYLHNGWKSESTVSLMLDRQTCDQPLHRILSFCQFCLHYHPWGWLR